MRQSVEEHYGELLQLEKPWRVSKVEGAVAQGKVTIWMEWPDGQKVSCPECGSATRIYDRVAERQWRHLSVMQYEVELRCAVPRCDCATHGVKTIAVPWAEKGSRFTLFFEAYAVEVMQACSSLSQAANLLRLHWESVQRIIDQAVQRGLARRTTEGITRVGLDEKSFLRGQRYVSLMTDLTEQRVLEVVPGHNTESALALWQALPEAQRLEVKAAAMDMGASFIAGTQQSAPQAQIVHDRFHVSKLVNEAVDQTRRQESNELAQTGDNSLKKTRFLWLHGQSRVPEKSQEEFGALLLTNLRTARAWAYKEQFVEFWQQPTREAGADFFAQWYRSVIRTKLPPLKKAAKTLKAHLAGLLSYFTHRITNALTEGFNSKIQAIKSAARGFRSFNNYRTRILFFCGKLDLAPPLPLISFHSIP
jgi:transposase